MGPVGINNGSNYVYAPSGTSTRRIANPDEVSNAGGGAPSGARGPKKKSWSFGTWAQNFLKGGIVDTVKDMLNPTSLLVMAGLAALWFIPGCQGIAAGATYAAIAGGVVFGGGKLVTKGATSITKAIDGDVDGSYEDARSAGNGFATLALSAAGARAVVKGGMPGVSVRGNNAALAGESATAATEAAASTPKSLRFFLKDFFVGGNQRVVAATGEVTEASLARLYWQNALSGVKGKIWGAGEMAAARTASAETALNAARAARTSLPATATPAEIASADAAVVAAETAFNASTTEAGLITTAASAPPPTGTRWERFRLGANETYQNGRAFVTDKANRGTIATGLGVGFANNNLSADLNALSGAGAEEGYGYPGEHGQPTLLGYDQRTGQPVWG